MLGIRSSRSGTDAEIWIGLANDVGCILGPRRAGAKFDDQPQRSTLCRDAIGSRMGASLKIRPVLRNSPCVPGARRSPRLPPGLPGYSSCGSRWPLNTSQWFIFLAFTALQRKRMDRLIGIARIANRTHTELLRQRRHGRIVREIDGVQLLDPLRPRGLD